MEKKNGQYGMCGVYCGQCPNGNSRVKMMAGELTVRISKKNGKDKPKIVRQVRKPDKLIKEYLNL